MRFNTRRLECTLLGFALIASWACSGSNTEEAQSDTNQNGNNNSGVPGMIEPGSMDTGFVDRTATTRFLTHATFGPKRADIDRFTGTSAASWVQQQMDLPSTNLRPVIERYRTFLSASDPEFNGELLFETTNYAFWENAIGAPDELRQRMSFALSQIFVVSNAVGDELTEHPEAVAYLQDVLTNNAFGNFRTILEQVTYSPAMAIYLTYLGNEKADPLTGRVPDENYAREIMQLFSIGTVELNLNGTPRLDSEGEAIETYNNTDIKGLAKVFTGLVLDEDQEDVWGSPLALAPQLHSSAEKTFLGQTIAASTPAAPSITQAIDIIFNHPNVAPFISRQLIQRFVTSNPIPAYVERVANAFNGGSYTLPNGEALGTGQRGDLAATLAAVLFDEQARSSSASSDPQFGKVREPVLRLTHFIRAFDADASRMIYFEPMWNPDLPLGSSQVPYQSPSVFNFYRPGYVAPGTSSGAAGMTVPELQIVSATTIPGDANLLQHLVFRHPQEVFFEETSEYFNEVAGIQISQTEYEQTLMPDYADELPLATNPVGLIDELDAYLSFGSLSSETKQQIADIVSAVQDDDDLRVRLAVYLVMTSEDYTVQR